MTAPTIPTQLLSYKYRIYPTRAQAEAFDVLLGALCDLYNAALQQRIEAYRRQGKTLGYFDQTKELKAVRAVDERLARFSSTTEKRVLRRLDKAFASFFRRLKQGKKPGFPRFRAKSMFDSAEMCFGDGLTIRKSKRLGMLGVPGEIKVKWHRPLPATPRAAVLSRSLGRWSICFQVEVPVSEPRMDFNPIGIDLGLTSLVALSTGELIPTPQITQNAAAALRRRQRKLSRAKRGSRGRTIARRAVARLQAKVAAQRRDGLHKLSHDLTRRFSNIAMEDLNVKGLARGVLAKAVHNVAWAQLAGMITYKAAKAGGVISLVDPRGTSRTCPECGTYAPKTLAIREHRCACGCVLDRDVAAAREILRRAMFEQPGTGCGAQSEPSAAKLAPRTVSFS